MGAEAVRELLRGLNLTREIDRLRKELDGTDSETKIKKIAKRLKVLEGFQKSGIKPKEYLNQNIEVITSNFKAGKIDSAVIWEPTASRLVQEGLARRIATGVQNNERDGGFMAMRADLIKARPDVVKAWLNAELDALMSALRQACDALLPGGRLVVCGATSGPNPPADLNRVFFLQLQVLGSTMGTKQELIDLMAFMERTGVRPPIQAVYSLDEADKAIERMASGDVQGKLVIQP